MSRRFVHRFIPNSAPGVREAMLKEIGLTSVDQIYEEIPREFTLKRELSLPRAGIGVGGIQAL